MSFQLQRNSTNIGFWGVGGSSVDWCEPNYQVTYFIAEFSNSMSSFSMVIAGLLGLYLHLWAEKRFHLAFISTILLGFGSVAFHGTLWKVCQAFDEVPMLYCVLTLSYISICHRYKPSNRMEQILGMSFLLYAVLLTILVTVSDGLIQFILFHVSFNSAHFFALYQCWLMYSIRKSKNNASKTRQGFILKENQKRILKTCERGALFYISAIICWLIDMFLCEYVNPMYSTSVLPFNPQLHSWWHFFISCALYHLSLMVLFERVETIKGSGSSRIDYFLSVIPYVAMNK